MIASTPTPLARLFCLALCFAFSSPPKVNSSPQSGVDLDAVISGVQNKYSRMKGLAADFVQIYQGPDGRRRRESGSLLLKRPGKARWNYTSPEQKIFVSDGKNIFFHIAGEKTATRAAIKQSVDPQIPFLFLLGRSELRKEFSRIELLMTETPIVAGNLVIRLVPKRAPEEFKQLLAEVSPTDFTINRLVIFERNQAVMNFVLSNVRENFAAPDTHFIFTPPPGVIIRQAQ
jgi:outer membrane lipoprotein carrier protein